MNDYQKINDQIKSLEAMMKQPNVSIKFLCDCQLAIKALEQVKKYL